MRNAARPQHAGGERTVRLTAVAAGVAVLCQAAPAMAADSPKTASTLTAVEVIATTPLPDVGLSREQIPNNVQTLGKEAIDDAGSVNLPDLMNRRLGSVFVNEIQGNPFQPDVSYRGFGASPLLGAPQGMSVYMDGVRLNQPFGDVVSWDMIPRSAVRSLALMPGSNPLFGLNTLGGALSLQTKDGYSDPGTAVQLVYGRHSRRTAEFEHGGHNDLGLHWFITGEGFKEDGWREDSPSNVVQWFGKLGWRDARTDLALSVALPNAKLTGNGLQEKRLLERDYGSIYTKPDETKNRSIFVNLTARHDVSDSLQFSGNAYYRKIRTSTFNGDINDDALDQAVYLTGTGNTGADRRWLAGNGYAGQFPAYTETSANTPFPFWRCIAQVGMAGEPAEKCNSLINRTETSQENYGLTGQFSHFGTIADNSNQFTAGLGYDASRVGFAQTSQFGYLNPDRSITPVNFFADGTSIGDDGKPLDSRVDLTGRTYTWSVFATDTISFRDVVHLTLSGRYNHTIVHNRDQINPGGASGSLDGDHRFSRFNPAIGIAYAPSPALSVYAGYNEGSRAPNTTELGCADPENPCKLPNAMAGDPPLKQVVTKTWEAGLRGAIGQRTHWNAGVFRAENVDDILFVADNAAGFGYFRNFGKTRRQGIELGLDSQIDSVTLSASYTYLDATFQTREMFNGGSNSSSDDAGRIEVRPGDRLPLIPRHMFKARADWQVTPAWSVGLGMLAVSGANALGNENGEHRADGTYFLGAGKSGGYTIFDLGARYRASRQLSFFAQINNLFDREYATAAQLGATAFTADGRFIARPFSSAGDNTTLVHSTFYAPGAPRTLWAGLRYEFDK